MGVLTKLQRVVVEKEREGVVDSTEEGGGRGGGDTIIGSGGFLATG